MRRWRCAFRLRHHACGRPSAPCRRRTAARRGPRHRIRSERTRSVSSPVRRQNSPGCGVGAGARELCAAIPHLFAVTGERVQRVGVEHRDLGRRDQLGDQRACLRPARDPRPCRERRLSLQRLAQRREIASPSGPSPGRARTSLPATVQRRRHLRACRERDQPRARAQRRLADQRRRAALPREPATQGRGRSRSCARLADAAGSARGPTPLRSARRRPRKPLLQRRGIPIGATAMRPAQPAPGCR